MDTYEPSKYVLTKYLFFTGKGGVGKTSVACATAIDLADKGHKVILVSTDPASNLQDVFERPVDNKGVAIEEVPGLVVANFEPMIAAQEYMASVVDPYRGILPDAAIANMEEQLMGSCTVEIAAFNEFATFLTDDTIAAQFDYVIFDTAPTGHTLRLLQLPSAWNDFLDENTTGTSCMGQLSGLGEKKVNYEKAIATLSDGKQTSLLLVTRPEEGPLKEANRASIELGALGIRNQHLIVNGVLDDVTDGISKKYRDNQQEALAHMPEHLGQLPAVKISLRPYNLVGINNLRRLFTDEVAELRIQTLNDSQYPKLQTIIDDLAASNKRVVFTMGKGGVGKTTIAKAIALGLAAKGKKVHLATTDPAGQVDTNFQKFNHIQMSRIDEKLELQRYTDQVLTKARATMSEEDIAYVEEDLRSPCTQEIAVFRWFAEIVAAAEADVVVIDTAPTGHTLLLLDSSQNYAKELKRSSGEVPEAVVNLLPVLQDSSQCEVVMVTLAENTPVLESLRLKEDLKRAHIAHTWWVVNNSMLSSGTTNPVLLGRCQNEHQWINKVAETSDNHFAVVAWQPNNDEIV